MNKRLLLSALAGLLPLLAHSADLSGTWRLDLPRRGEVTVHTYFLLQQNGTKLDGKVVINGAVDLPLLDARIEAAEGVFSVAWNTAYRVRLVGADRLHVRLTYGDKRSEEAEAVRVPEAELAPPPAIPAPPLEDLPWNGLAQTPPMGWNSWNHFGDRVDDQIVRSAADALVESGLAAAGYVYINIDDGWEGGRDAQGRIVSNSKFPEMKALADYVHACGLKLGLYSTPGPVTCCGYEGSYGHEEQDAQTLAEWGVDYLKYDWCSGIRVYRPDEVRAAFQKMGVALQRCGRPIVFSINPGIRNGESAGTWAPLAGANLWRTTDDIRDDWETMSAIGFGQADLEPYARPGHWNDPDMLEVGNGGMTTTEYRTHFSLWCLLSAPLMAGHDLRSMSAETLEILSNREAIALDQDPLGRQATRVFARDGVEVWVKSLSDGDRAIGVFNRSDAEKTAAFSWSEIGLAKPPRVLRDLWQHADLEPQSDGFSALVPSHGVVLLRLQ